MKSSAATLRSSLSGGEVRRQSVAEEILNRWKNPQSILGSVSSFGGSATAPPALPATLTSSTSAPELAALHESEEEIQSSEIPRAASDEAKHSEEHAVEVGLPIAHSPEVVLEKSPEPAISAPSTFPTSIGTAKSTIPEVSIVASMATESSVRAPAPPAPNSSGLPVSATERNQQSVSSVPATTSAEYAVSDASRV